MIDYKELLIKYIQLIVQEEGITYLDRAAEHGFTPEEIEELSNLST